MITIIFLSSIHATSLTGQIKQWNLIFYGTDEPPQKNDPPRYLGNNKKTINELNHNSLENTQWSSITKDVSDAYFFIIERSLSSYIDMRGVLEGLTLKLLLSILSGSECTKRDLGSYLW